jgi:3,4-dihydroxyphenylacetate 2,3-dioxygenase
MGEIVAAALVSHQPGIMLPEEVRVAVGHGRDTSLVEGFSRVRDALDRTKADIFVIFDTHWVTTATHLVGGLDRYRGTYTSDEVPDLICDYAYDYFGAPELASRVEELGRGRGVPIKAVRSPHMANHYGTLNVLHYVHREERVMSAGVCQTARPDDHLAFGALLRNAISEVEGRVAILASGGLSHAFHPLGELRARSAWDAANVSSQRSRELDARVLELWSEGDHAAVMDLWGEYESVQPEGHFGHYFQMLGALGGRSCGARGVPMSRYESSLGTGQVHVWFDCG